MKLLYTFFICFFSIVHLFSQGWQQDYIADTANMGYGMCLDVRQTMDGGYIMVGEMDLPTGAIRHYVQLLKTDANGLLEWRKTYTNYWDIAYDEGVAVFQTPDGGYMIGGTSNGDMMVMKTDANGDTLWRKLHGTPMSDHGKAMATTNDGGYVLAGTTFIPNEQNIFVVKVNANGDSLWSITIGSGGIDVFMEVFDVQQTIDNGYILIGRSNGALYVAKLTNTGALAWSKTHSLGTNDVGYAIRQTPLGNYIIAGSIDGFAGSSPLIVKIDGNGELIWSKILGINPHSKATDIEIMSNGQYAITGSLYNFAYNGGNVGFMGVVDTAGNEIWMRDLDTASNASGAAIEQTTDGGFIIGGINQVGYYLLKLDSLGLTPTQQQQQLDLTITVAPNPIVKQATITITGAEMAETFTFKLYDVKGQLLRHQKVSYQFIFNSQGLSKGVYFYEIQTKGLMVGRGKLVISN